MATLYGQQQCVLALGVPFVASAEAQTKALLGSEALSTESCWQILMGGSCVFVTLGGSCPCHCVFVTLLGRRGGCLWSSSLGLLP